jgi:hypothetical protein
VMKMKFAEVFLSRRWDSISLLRVVHVQFSSITCINKQRIKTQTLNIVAKQWPGWQGNCIA